jgi:TPR repeat protein
MSFAMMARAGWMALVALLCVCAPLLAAQTDEVTPSEAEKRAFASQDPRESQRWLKIAAEAGLRDAQWLLGDDYLRGTLNAEKKPEQGIELLSRAAAQGSARAQSMLGWAYFTGTGVKQDSALALKWFTNAARQEDGYSLAFLSGFYYHGVGADRDYPRAKRLLLRAAELGDSNGLAGSWNLLLLGPTADRNPQLGMHFLTRAAAAGDVNGAYVLGREYLTGRDVPRDFTRAVNWLERAAKSKHALASLWLSELCAKGLGMQQDAKRGEQMLQAALHEADIGQKNLFSWALSVAPDAQLRNAALAIRVLEPALAAEQKKSPAHLDTLAAAYAEHGEFAKAVATQTEAIDLARGTRQVQQVDTMEQRLELYRASKAYREQTL